MALIQPIIDLVDILAQQGLTHAVVCPGSRSAALTLAFARNPAIHTTVSIDERSAGFIALGMAVELQKPVALICTSGTAAYNFAPAVAEAFFQRTPLLVITADRPAEWIHQHDGQTIYQREIFGKHVKASLEFPADTQHADSVWFANRISNEAYLAARTFPMGPVHLNVPVREPFYPEADEVFRPGDRNRVVGRLQEVPSLAIEDWHFLQDEWEKAENVLIAAGQGLYSPQLSATLNAITEEWEVPVLGDVTANLGGHADFISLQDVLLQSEGATELVPDLLITFGQSFLSKKFRQFVRKHPPRQHWHIGRETLLIDSLQSLTLQIPVEPAFFFRKMFEDIDYKQRFTEEEEAYDSGYKREWLARERLAARIVSEHSTSHALTDLAAMRHIVELLADDARVHLGNSMPVRYGNLLQRLGLRQLVWANRGTSGIDGCVSTAIGAALVASKEIVLFVGDVSFLYDRNGFLIERLPENLRIVVLNNGGGNIFRMIDGPARQPELERFFETRHHFTAQATAQDAGIRYLHASNPAELLEASGQFRSVPGPVILEIMTDPDENKKVLAQINHRYRSEA